MAHRIGFGTVQEELREKKGILNVRASTTRE
jgi:hypothetical protein